MKILGINISHDASSCLIEDGKVLYFKQEERLSRRKHHQYKFGKGDQHLLQFQDILLSHTDEVDYVIYSRHGFHDYRYSHDRGHFFNRLKTELDSQLKIRYKKSLMSMFDHHVYHACSGYYFSPFEEAACLVIDGGGGYNRYIDDALEIESIYHITPDSITPKYKHYRGGRWERGEDKSIISPSVGPAFLFNVISAGIGYDNHGHSAGKVMGLSTYGIIDDDKPWFHTEYGLPVTTVSVDPDDYNAVDFNERANLCRKLQEESFKMTVFLIEKAIDLTGSKNIILSGGYALNCLNNGRYLEHFKGINFFADPVPDDAGTSLGAALYLFSKLK